MSAKSRKVSCPTLPLFKTYYRKTGLFLSEWAYFRSPKNNVNFTKTCFLKTRSRVHMKIYVNKLRHKYLLYGTKHLYSHTAFIKQKIVEKDVEGLQFLLSLVELCNSFPQWGP